MGPGGVGDRGRGHDGQRDPVGDVEAGVAAGLLDGADQVAGHALGLELGRDRGVEHDEAAAGQHPGRASRRRPPATVSRVNSPSSSASPPAVTVPSSATDQSPDLEP